MFFPNDGDGVLIESRMASDLPQRVYMKKRRRSKLNLSISQLTGDGNQSESQEHGPCHVLNSRTKISIKLTDRFECRWEESEEDALTGFTTISY